jgi:hypothetical protein
LLSYDRLSKKPSLFKSFTGLSIQQFNGIYKEIKSKYEKYEIKRLSSKRRRERDIGAGRHFKLVVEDRVVMVLVYYRLYITYTLTEFLFGLDQSNVYRDIQKIEGLIRQQCLPIPHKLYKITRRLKTKEEVKQYFPGFLAFIDATEQSIPRPENRIRRKLYYSGKKKKHTTVKNLYMVNNDELILYKTKHKQVVGRRHDYKIYKKNHPVTPKDVEIILDLGFLRVEKDYPEQISSLPIKKKKGNQDLTIEEKEYNRIHSKKRIVIEHAICRLKKYRIMSEVFRNRLRKYDMISDIVSGMVNYRIMNSI